MKLGECFAVTLRILEDMTYLSSAKVDVPPPSDEVLGDVL